MSGGVEGACSRGYGFHGDSPPYHANSARYSSVLPPAKQPDLAWRFFDFFSGDLSWNRRKGVHKSTERIVLMFLLNPLKIHPCGFSVFS